MAFIEAVGAREILDSRGNPTVEVEVLLDDGTVARAAVPSGASTGAFEAYELRDGDSDRYLGKGVQKAVDAVSTSSARRIEDLDASDQRLVDAALIEADGTDEQGPPRRQRHPRREPRRREGRRRLGRPAAVPLPRRPERARPARADDEHHQRRRARRQRHRLPGVHARCRSARRPSPRRLRWGVETYHALKSLLKAKGLSTGLGDEGGFAPDLEQQPRGARLHRRGDRQGRLHARHRHRARPRRRGDRVLRERRLPLEGKDRTRGRDDRVLRRARRRVPARLDRGRAGRGRLGRLGELTDRRSARSCSSSATTCSSPTRSASPTASHATSANSILVKVNQIGTLTETLDAVTLAQRAGYTAVLSHRSGETEDTTIADLAVATELRPDQDAARPPGASASPSTISFCASRKSSVRPRCTRAARRSPDSRPEAA